MKISINNFKSIGSLVNYEMRPLTILSGTNSSGKSSFIQLLLLLKQTLQDDSAQRALDIKGDFFKVRRYLDIIKGKTKDNKLKIELKFNKSELSNFKDFYEINFYDAAFDNYDLHINTEFDFIENQIIVSLFEVKFISIEAEYKESFIRFENKNKILNIETDSAVFNDDLYKEKGKYKINKINYSSFIPSDVEIEFVTEIINLENQKTIEKSAFKLGLKLDGIKAILHNFFNSLNYVGPLRQPPKDEYSIYGKGNSVGIEGENVAEVISLLSDQHISFFKIAENDDNISFIKNEDLFLNAVKYWLCEKFKLCSEVYSIKEGDSYVIYVQSNSGVKSTIKHVGFGISQLLPIVVEGLRIGIGETLILEQPEIHLHPKVQSQLTDFLLSLIEQGKKVIIETHSDHLITRLRRRIAEDPSNQLDDNVLLTFVEVGTSDILFRSIDIDDFGNLDYFPDDFIEKPDAELKAILKAQMKKRLNQKGI
jgi:predicted ATPase